MHFQIPYALTRHLMLAAIFLLPISHATAIDEGAKTAAQTRLVAQDNLVYMQTSTGMVVIELTDSIAPNHVNRFKQLVAEGFYDGLDFYRVIDGFVAQAGDVSEQKATKFKQPLKAEFSRTNSGHPQEFVGVQQPAFLAQETGFIEDFPAGRNLDDDRQWLLHCPGMVAMARNNEADSATTEFYIVIGQAPRHLDRNMSVFGQVVYGLQNVQAMHRGDPAVGGGVIENKDKRTVIVSAKLGAQVPPSEQLQIVRDTAASDAFQQRLSSARSLDNPFYHYSGTGNIDVCYYRPRVTVKSVGAE